jgi:hypothetical protein
MARASKPRYGFLRQCVCGGRGAVAPVVSRGCAAAAV